MGNLEDRVNDPRNFGDYQIIRPLGRGAMGEVYVATHRLLGGHYALKRMSDAAGGDDELVKRFRREARALFDLNHPNIVRLFSFSEVHGQHYIVMELVDGEKVRSFTQTADKKIPVYRPEEALRIVKEAAFGLAYAHRQGVIHRDVKPDNLLLTKKGKVKVSDFGLVRRLKDPTLTIEGDILGTPAFMPPEQARGNNKNVGVCSDVYSLGATLYILLTGYHPYEEQKSSVSVLMRVLDESDAPTPILEHNPHVPYAIAAICKKMMAKEVRIRYQSMDEVIAAIDRYERGLLRSYPKISALIGTAAVALLVALPFYLALRSREREQQATIAARVAQGDDYVVAGDLERALTEYTAAGNPEKIFGTLVALSRGAGHTREGLRWYERARDYFGEHRAELSPNAAEQLEGLIGKGTVTIRAPAGSEIVSHEIFSRDGNYTTADEENVLGTVGEDGTLSVTQEPGDYILKIRNGEREVTYPMLLEPGETETARIEFPIVPENFVFIPPFEAYVGSGYLEVYKVGDFLVIERHGEVQKISVDGFALSRTEVSMQEYDAFLREMCRRGVVRDVMHPFVPKWSITPHPNMQGSERGWANIVEVERDEQTGRPVLTLQQDYRESAAPIVGIGREAALAYVEWRGIEIPGLVLPTDVQLEAAARGADGRRLPWGNVDDPSRYHFVSPEQRIVLPAQAMFGGVGEPASGASVFGVFNLADNVAERTNNVAGNRSSSVIGRVIGSYDSIFGGSWASGPGLGERTGDTLFGYHDAGIRFAVGFR